MNKLNEIIFWQNLFEAKMVNLYGMSFQMLFHFLMKAKFKGDFDTPKPSGNMGDFGNDGYIGREGIYFSVYSPHTSKPNSKKIITKFESDFNKLIENKDKWPYELKKFVFVLNIEGKIELLSPKILITRDNFQKKYQKITIEFWTQTDLNKIFTSLSIEEKSYIIKDSYISVDSNFSIDASFIDILITKLIKYELNYRKVDYNLIKFDSKIKLNNLTPSRADDLRHAGYYIKNLNDILDQLYEYSSEYLSNHIKEIYEKSLLNSSDSNIQFDYIESQLNDSKSQFLILFDKKTRRDQVLVIMSKFFENCTIFKKGEGNEI